MSKTTAFDAPPRRYTDAQLARLLEISSDVDCECPNHVSKIVTGLVDFETYSKNCENRNEEDAHIHAMLYRASARARAIMEEAMAELLDFEKIEV